MSDLPMVADGIKTGQHVPGGAVTNYFEEYADKFHLNKHFRFHHTVSSIERLGQRWRVATAGGPIFIAEKVIVATGMTSEAFIPSIPGSETFGAPLIHSRDLPTYAKPLLKSPTSVTIYGGRKSAQDAVYYFASNGVKVNWVIRDSGHGPGMLMSTKPVLPGVGFDQPVMMRVLSWLSPCIWGDSDGYATIRWLLHGTRLGSRVIEWLWNSLGKSLEADNKYDSHPKMQKLKPRYRSEIILFTFEDFMV